MKVPLLDLKAQYAGLREPIESAIREVCEEQRFVLGPRVAELEQRIAAYSSAKFGVGVSSGTDALLLALMGLDIGPGDEVITSPYTFFATAGVVARLNARPVFCDIEPTMFNLAPDAVESFLAEQCERRGEHLINRRTGGTVKAIMPVHLYGQAAAMDRLTAIAGRYGLRVVEDAAQAIGAETSDGRRAGSIGDIGCFSFFPSKNLGAFGDAGMCVVNDADLHEKLRVLRVHGGKPKYYHAMIGGNFRLDELQAAVLLVKLDRLDAWTSARQRNASHYTDLLADHDLGAWVRPPQIGSGRHIFNQYVVRCAERDGLRAHLTEAGIGTEIYYPVSLHEQKCFEYLGYAPDDLPESKRAAGETLALPIYPELSADQREYVVERIAAYYRR